MPIQCQTSSNNKRDKLSCTCMLLADIGRQNKPAKAAINKLYFIYGVALLILESNKSATTTT